ncbi:MAG: transporter substrate-binding domain-containing protein [Ekhidna sp.]|nr:transporter substrate-binding domain-containing protein [Ekhidna sp.]
MKLSIKIICLFIAFSLFIGCRPSVSSGQVREQKQKKEFIVNFDFDKIKERGFLTAIMDNSSTGLFIYKGRTMGYEYELLRLFCNEHNLQLRINITPNLKEAFNKLNTGDGDLLAYNLTVTKERKKRISFTRYHNLQKQVLIQRKPKNWRELKLHEIEAALIRNPINLIGKKVYVRPHSSYYDRLVNLSDEIGGDITIVPGESNAETEELIRMVADGEIDYTVAEENVALVNAIYYPVLDIKTAVSFPTQIAWGIRKDSPELLSELNSWIDKMKKKTEYYVIYNKYFKTSKSALKRSRSRYSTINKEEDNISPYDALIQEAAKKLNWDWYLLAAQIYKESKFDPDAESWAGARGLMQVMPITGEEYSVKDLFNPKQNIFVGTSHLLWLQNQWKNKIQDKNERIKFVLASYNVGLGHVQDAVRLTKKYGGSITSWEDVSGYLLKKSYKKFFTDPVVQFGYCRGEEPVQYVKVINDTYRIYKDVLRLEEPTASLVNRHNFLSLT